MDLYVALICAALVVLAYFFARHLIAIIIDAVILGLAIYLFVTGHVTGGIVVLLILAFLLYVQGW